ncbi:Imm32 family immunity protein [Streptomyces fungicidicus]|uniref:Imm32 family immunity protein n=1 Tax=Streptomyces fungicidicus TaxID=68203 RepID=UPI0038242C07
MDEPRIKVYGSATEITVAANAAGLRDLAERLIGLADPELSDGYHQHLDSGLDLEDGSVNLVLERDDKL